jgi:hypothetical protein
VPSVGILNSEPLPDVLAQSIARTVLVKSKPLQQAKEKNPTDPGPIEELAHFETNH